MGDEFEPGLSDRYRKASPWPFFVAVGVVVSEVGVVLGLFPVTVGGLLLFGGTVAGILRESGYVGRPAVALATLGLLLLGIGGLAVGITVPLDALSVEVLLDRNRGWVYRGSAIATAGVILLALAVVIRGTSVADQ